ncbi:MAG TPA: VWA domain-containing protein [Bacteroidales bacterium]|nr:VWA domain-containing protein [Bacteroidales bacterium]HON20652.1 VWA domain-containing protein [Bacteroidales bacterium]HOR82443.1 VWA domain-containing protein [Bacteroidales bacterium]HPX58891.1 VWA domain-containing protein [Bacteroidales bacterium]
MKHITYFINYLSSLDFLYPKLLFLLLLIPVFIAFYIWKRKKIHAPFVVSGELPFKHKEKSIKQRLFFLPFVLRMLVFSLVIIALARPQSSFSHKTVDVEGIDIVMALDISSSMMAMDLKPNRMEASKNVIKKFIENRPNDRIGLVVYSGEAFTKCPLTSDHRTLLSTLKSTTFGYGIIDDGTAIGDGLGTAINRLRESKAKSKVVILLSDGANNTGYLDPLSAAEIAKEYQIRVYTIGCGTYGKAPINIPNYGLIYAEVDIDEDLLQNIADKTNGKYFRAQNTARLKVIYEEINKMEKTRIQETLFTNKSDEFFPFLLIALVIFTIEFVLRYTVFRIYP